MDIVPCHYFFNPGDDRSLMTEAFDGKRGCTALYADMRLYAILALCAEQSNGSH